MAEVIAVEPEFGLSRLARGVRAKVVQQGDEVIGVTGRIDRPFL